MSFDFFASGLHTRTAVARLPIPLRQLGFLVKIIPLARSVVHFLCQSRRLVAGSSNN